MPFAIHVHTTQDYIIWSCCPCKHINQSNNKGSANDTLIGNRKVRHTISFFGEISLTI